MKRILFLLGISASCLQADPLITEIMASNSGPVTDQFQETPDWIEITNPDATSVNLSGWSLTDDQALHQKWGFPAVELAPGARILIMASGRNLRVPGEILHTNFKLGAAGGVVQLTPPANGTASVLPYPRQFNGVSYGMGQGNALGYFLNPTPGQENGVDTLPDYVRDTSFSVDRGFYTMPFTVALSSQTPGAEIRYTLDGSTPVSTSPLYTTPLPINTTTVLRIRGFKSGLVPSNVDTATYVFANTWRTQPDFPAGFSKTWGSFNASLKWKADYGMNMPVINNATYGPLMIPALTTTLPVLCVTGDAAEIFGDAGLHGDLRQTNSEVPVGVEFFNPQNPSERWTARAGFQIHGGGVRDFAKKAFRLDFSGGNGDGSLKAPLFPGSKAEQHDQLVLRGGGHDSFTARVRGGSPDNNDRAFHATYMRDQFLRRTEVEAGLISPRGRYVHLCLNGLYWGLYDLHERPNAEFFAANAGGEQEDWDVLHHGPQQIDGTADAWENFLIKASFGAATANDYNDLATLAGPDAFIDHLLIRMWGADHDWLGPVTMPSSTTGTTADVAYYNNKNWYAGRRTRGDAPGPWHFFTWDGEISMGSHLLFGWFDNRPTPAGLDFPRFRELRLDMTGISQPGTPAAVWAALQQWPPFRLKVADRARRMFGAGGALSPVRAAARVEALRQELDLPMVAETARWGTVSGFTFVSVDGQVRASWDNTQLDRDTHWRPEVAWLRDTWCTERTPVFLGQLQARGLYPSTVPPDIFPPGGALGVGESFTLSSPAGTIHYTTNGQDPMEGGPAVLVWPAGQRVVPAGPFTVKARVRNSTTNEWSALTEYLFTNAVLPAPGMLVISEIHYHPSPGTAAEAQAGFATAGLFEFLEIANVSGQRVQLGSLRFSEGIDFDFATDSSLTEIAPGGVLLLASNAAAFTARYGAGLPVAGVFANGTNLSNGGERLKLVTASGLVVAEMTYDDSGDWPSSPDGSGKSLILLDPAAGSTGRTADAWRPSSSVNGTPGLLSPPLTFALWLNDYFTPAQLVDPDQSGTQADPDGDGLVNLMEYALLKNPLVPSKSAIAISSSQDGRVRFTWDRRRAAADISALNTVLELQQGDLPWAAPVAGPGVSFSLVNTGEGSDRQTVEIDPLLLPRVFVRIRVQP